MCRNIRFPFDLVKKNQKQGAHVTRDIGRACMYNRVLFMYLIINEPCSLWIQNQLNTEDLINNVLIEIMIIMRYKTQNPEIILQNSLCPVLHAGWKVVPVRVCMSLDTVKIGALVIGSLCKSKTADIEWRNRFTGCTYRCTCVYSGGFSTSVCREGERGPEK